jgi:hypothetical protein
MNKIISEVSTRIEVTSLADALPTYQTLAGTDDVHRFQFPEFAVAVVGPLRRRLPCWLAKSLSRPANLRRHSHLPPSS